MMALGDVSQSIVESGMLDEIAAGEDMSTDELIESGWPWPDFLRELTSGRRFFPIERQ
jgi:hypothetical protein